MSTFSGDESLRDDESLVNFGIEIRLHADIGSVGGPLHKIIDGTLRAVGVEDFETVAEFFEVVADGEERVGGGTSEEGDGLLIAGDAFADEVEGTIIAYFKNNIGHDIGDGDKP